MITIHTVGDSHSMNGWERITLPGVSIAIHHLGPKLMHSFGRDALELVNIRNLNVKAGEYVCFCFGEIDCRCHIYKYKETWKENIEHIASSYIDAISQNEKLVPGVKVMIQSVTPTANINTYRSKDFAWPHLGTNEERKLYTKYLNECLKLRCDERGYIFLDVHDEYATDGMLNNNYSDQEVHIRNPCFIVKFINTNLLSNTMTIFSHSGNLGDIIWALPTLHYYGPGELNVVLDGVPAAIRKYNNGPVFPEYEGRLSQKDFDMIAPLLASQPYITKVQPYDGTSHIDYDLDEFRGTVGQAFKTNFIETFAQTFHHPASYEPWLFVEPKKVANFVVTRTTRYHSNRTTTIPTWMRFIQEYNLGKEGVFMGFQNEHKQFKALFNEEILN